MSQHTLGVIIFVLSRTCCLQTAVFPSYVSLRKGRTSESFRDGRKSGRVITSEEENTCLALNPDTPTLPLKKETPGLSFVRYLLLGLLRLINYLKDKIIYLPPLMNRYFGTCAFCAPFDQYIGGHIDRHGRLNG